MARLGAGLSLAAGTLAGGSPVWAQAAAPVAAPAPEHLVNLDTPPAGGAAGTTTARANVRVFGDDEKITYTTLDARYKLPEGAGARFGGEVLLRGTFAPKRTLAGTGFNLRHGGNDAELLAKLYSPQQPNLAFALGVSLPDTPAQDDPHVSAQILYRYEASPTVSLFFAPKAIFIEDNTLVGIGGGVAARLSTSLQLVADVTAVVEGDNTYDIRTGNRKQESALYGLALRFTPPRRNAAPDTGELSIEVGVTNAIGGTTGFSLTPGLDNSTAAFVGLSYRR